MPEFVHGDEIQREATERAGCVLPGAVGGEEGRVFHAAGFVRAVGRDHRGDRAVRIGAQGLREIRQRVDGRLQHRACIRGIVRRIQHADLHRAVRAVPGLHHRLGETLVRGPGEVVHVVLQVAMGHLAVLLHRRSGQFAGGTDGVAAGHGDAHVVTAEIGVELAVQVELVGVPARGSGTALARQFQHADLREPLRHQVETAVVAGARDHSRQLVEEVDVEAGACARGDRLRQVDAHHAAVGARATVGLHEAPSGGLAGLLHLVQANVAVLAVAGVDIAAEAAFAGTLLGHEGAAGAVEAVEIQVHIHAADRLCAAVAPGQLLLAGDRVPDRVELGVDGIRHHPIGQRRFVAGARAAPGGLGTRGADRAGVRSGQRDRRAGRRCLRCCRWRGHRMGRCGPQQRNGQQGGSSTGHVHGQVPAGK